MVDNHNLSIWKQNKSTQIQIMSKNGELINKRKKNYLKFITCNGYVPDQRPSQPLNPVDSLWLSLERGLPVIGIPSREA